MKKNLSLNVQYVLRQVGAGGTDQVTTLSNLVLFGLPWPEFTQQKVTGYTATCVIGRIADGSFLPVALLDSDVFFSRSPLLFFFHFDYVII